MIAPAVLALVVGLAARRLASKEVAWPDECIYLVGARNVVEKRTLNTNFYLAYSLMRRPYPHRDVHMPGYVLALAPVVAAMGASLEAAGLLNIALFAGCALLVYALARAVIPERSSALAASLLFTVLPPFPGYLFVAYPEIVVTFAFLAGLSAAAHARGPRGAAAAGLVFGLGALFRETLLLGLPIHLALLPRRERVRAFLPAAVATLVLVVAPLSRDRAVHPNALYPSVLEDARRSGEPLRTFVAAVARNVGDNVEATLHIDPMARAEDAALLAIAVLTVAAAVAMRRRPDPAPRLLRATLLSLGLLTAAVVALYVVRERGGVWGGVRAYMAWMPWLLVLATPLVASLRARVRRIAIATVTVALALALDHWQIRFFNRYKATDHEDQARNARYLARYIDEYRPLRILSRSFLYGYTHYPVEVIWSLPRDGAELAALNERISYDFIALHEKSALRHVLIGNPRYLRVNREDRGAEFLIWRRLY